MTTKKIPQRMCVGCREMRDKRDLIRIVRVEDGAVFDGTGKKPGRGAYICKNQECLDKAKKSRGLERALKVKISEEVYAGLFEALENAE